MTSPKSKSKPILGKRRLIGKTRYLIVPLFLLLFVSAPMADEIMDLNNKALRTYKRGNYEDSYELFTQVLDLGMSGGYETSVSYASVYYNRGLCLKKLKLWEEAANDFSMVIGFFPTDADAYYERGGCYNMMGLDEESERDHLKACDLEDKYCTEKMLKDKRERDKEWYEKD